MCTTAGVGVQWGRLPSGRGLTRSGVDGCRGRGSNGAESSPLCLEWSRLVLGRGLRVKQLKEGEMTAG